jgi:hypothetical protein
LQHEHAPPRAVFLGTHVRLEDLVGKFRGGVLVALLGLGKVAEQPAEVARLLLNFLSRARTV